jgi:DNA-binding transcriptional regulator YdaS (Cro superfamily)
LFFLQQGEGNMVSRKFKIAVKLSGTPAWKIAQQAGLHPATLSKFISGAEKVLPGDARVIRIGKLLGLRPEECFERTDINDTGAVIWEH